MRFPVFLALWAVCVVGFGSVAAEVAERSLRADMQRLAERNAYWAEVAK
jgi:hypothetical protein|tara:strand:+ start:657 stop:803 length:147 start_codon:yes stop_codon:yes gene_type:complete